MKFVNDTVATCLALLLVLVATSAKAAMGTAHVITVGDELRITILGEAAKELHKFIVFSWQVPGSRYYNHADTGLYLTSRVKSPNPQNSDIFKFTIDGSEVEGEPSYAGVIDCYAQGNAAPPNATAICFTTLRIDGTLHGESNEARIAGTSEGEAEIVSEPNGLVKIRIKGVAASTADGFVRRTASASQEESEGKKYTLAQDIGCVVNPAVTGANRRICWFKIDSAGKARTGE